MLTDDYIVYKYSKSVIVQSGTNTSEGQRIGDS